ncbi:SRPBCC family protein [Algoriphagus sp. C2-6-M1]|uniref:SRPBCC family protein n=1 Tax=Algoriphagus persicinus TaxID=3108754 RepID=UPI002B3A8F0A|nr:SRPBCC family protein [Algoriphagus sp. C2-6-M1]MEB2781431.1 SRPBCC family protein [Algoriphagus sp. C2-6-M1]
MTQVKVTKTINVPAHQVWEKVSSFKGIEEFSPIASSVTEGEGIGTKRKCYMPDGAEISERLELVDNSTMTMQYKITEGPFPITGYLSTIKVKPLGDSACEVTWGSEFDVGSEAKAQMEELFGGFYNVIIDGLESLINKQN